jgi:short-subunit dehydrogenase
MKSSSAARPTALITGASSGIGEALAQCFATGGHDLILVARSADKLQALATTLTAKHGVQVWVEPADLAKPDAAHQLFATLQRKARTVDVLVNCAGVLEQDSFVNMTLQQHRGIIDLNITGLTAMLAHFVAPMVERGAGRVLNVASIAAFQPIPTLSTYAASKAYVLSLSESMVEELRGTGVTLTTLCPGITATPMLKGATSANAQLSQLPDFLISPVDDVAQQGFDACLRGDAICVPGALNRMAMIASRGTPKWLVRRIGGILGRKAF